jgi:hypothetical protein
VDEAPGKAQLKQLISRDLPLIYFFCHSERPNGGSQETYLGIGKRELVTPANLVGWVQEACQTRRGAGVGSSPAAGVHKRCHSAELDPAALFSYIDVFVGGGDAAGVIGTEVRVSQSWRWSSPRTSSTS